jgi:ACS family tartrate transporter-like MFS transporter
MVAMPIAGIISAPISVFLMSLDGFMGLRGWQNMFVFEGALAVILGVIAYSYLPDRPTSAKWLSPTQKSALLTLIGTEPALPKVTWQTRLKILFCSLDVMLMCVIFFSMLSGLYAISFWLPQIVKGLGLSIKEVGIVAAIPFVVAAIAMVTWSRISDSSGKHVRHLVGTSATASLGFIIAAVFSKSPPGIIVGLSIALAGALAAGPIFWAYATSILKAEWSAPSIAIVTSLGTLGGVVTPAFIGFVKEISGEFAISLGSLALIPGMGVIATLWLCARQKRGKEIGANLDQAQPIPSIITG